jgi:hypothetical protein
MDAMHDPLCHVIYAEQRDDFIHGFVQLFGSIQFWVQLATRVPRRYSDALIAILDPVTGIEKFAGIPRLSLPPFREEVVDALEPVRKLNACAAQRGAKTAEMLKVNEVCVDGVPLRAQLKPYWVTSWTGDRRKKKT